MENTVHDHRVDDLVELMGQIFGLYTRLAKVTAAAGNQELPPRLSADSKKLAEWWDRFASTEVDEVEGFSGRQAWESAAHVASVLREWHAAGTAAGDLAFWRGHLDRFQSAKAYALVAESLLEQHDLVAVDGPVDPVAGPGRRDPPGGAGLFLLRSDAGVDGRTAGAAGEAPSSRAAAKASLPPERWTLARKMLDYIEANADEYWRRAGAGAWRRDRRGRRPFRKEDEERKTSTRSRMPRKPATTRTIPRSSCSPQPMKT